MCEFPIVIPKALHEMVQEFVASAIFERPDNFVDYAVEYHKNLKEITQQNASDKRAVKQIRGQRLKTYNGTNLVANQPLEIFPMKSLNGPSSTPPDTILYRTCDTPPPWPPSKSADVYLTDLATGTFSNDVTTLVSSNEDLDRIKYPITTTGNGSLTPIHFKLSTSSPTLHPNSSSALIENNKPQSKSLDPKANEEIVCKCCGMVFRRNNDHEKHFALHFVRGSSFGVPYSSSSPLFNGSKSESVTLFKCLVCNLLFKQMLSLRIHTTTHTPQAD